MRIISKFKDYYDCMQSYQDEDVWVRDTVLHDPLRYHRWHSADVPATTMQAKQLFKQAKMKEYPFVVYLAGKSYAGINIHIDLADGTSINEYFYTPESIQEFEEKNGINISDSERLYRTGKFKLRHCIEARKLIFDTKPISDAEIEKMHRDYSSPVILEGYVPAVMEGDYKRVAVNPDLSKLKFFKVLDSYQAFQEIDMYRSGILGVGEPEMIELSDEYKRDKHGFDNMSFKKAKNT